MKRDIVTYASILILGISGTFGALKVFATKSELQKVAAESKCGDIQYEIDKVTGRMWKIEDRYGGVTSPSRMNATDARRYRSLMQQLEIWREHQKTFKCTPRKESS